MGTVARRQIGFLSGNPQLTTVKFVVASFTDAPITVAAYTTAARTGSPVATATVNESSGSSPKLAKYCNDRGSNDPAGETWLCWVGSSTLTGLSAGTRYYLKLSQELGGPAGTIVETDASTCTAPAAGSDFNVFVMGCDISYPQGSATYYRGPGTHTAVYQRASADLTVCSYGVFADDLGYGDGVGQNTANPLCLIVDDETGKSQTGASYLTGLAYDMGIFYLAWLGMLDDTDLYVVRWGRDEYRNWNVRNMPWALSNGDHEYQDEIGFQFAAATANSSYALGNTAWDNLFSPLLPTPDIRTATGGAGRHYSLVLGDLRILCLDCVTFQSGDTGSVYDLPTNIASVYGANQLDDVLDAATEAEPFKVLVIGYGGQDWWKDSDSGNTWKPQKWLGKYPMRVLQPTEYRRLFLDEGEDPPSLMDNPATNGVEGCLIVAQGDTHCPMVWRTYGYGDQTPGTSGTGLRADWTTFWFSATNREQVKVVQEAIDNVEGVFHNGMEMKQIGELEEWDAAGTGSVYHFGALQLAVEGSRATKQLTARLLTCDGATEPDLYPKVAYEAVYRVGSNRPRNQIHPDREVY